MVAPTRKQTVLLPRKWILPLGLLMLLLLGFVAVLPDLEHHDEASSLGLQDVLKSLDDVAPPPPLPRVFDKSPSLDCDTYLDIVRHNTSEMGVDANDQKVFTKYMTKYEPPFWISIPVNDEHLMAMKVDQETFQKGIYAPDRFEDTDRFEGILQKELDLASAPLVFWNLQDWGWYPLLGASKSLGQQRHVYVLQPASVVHTIRMCEAARMNRWTKQSGRDGFSVYLSGKELATTISSEWQESKQKTVGIFKMEGSDLSRSIEDARDLLGQLKIRYLWVEWKTEDKHNDPKAIFDQISKLKKFKPWWPASKDYESFVEARCTANCSLWWKGD
jgi:hypothetical protein